MANHRDVARALARRLRARPSSTRNSRRPRQGAARRPDPVGSHRDVEFAVDDHYFKTFEEAAAFATALALTTTVRIELDVVVSSRDGAVWWGGPEGGQDYDEDPEASVFDRLVVKVTSQGRVP